MLTALPNRQSPTHTHRARDISESNRTKWSVGSSSRSSEATNCQHIANTLQERQPIANTCRPGKRRGLQVQVVRRLVQQKQRGSCEERLHEEAWPPRNAQHKTQRSERRFKTQIHKRVVASSKTITKPKQQSRFTTQVHNAGGCHNARCGLRKHGCQATK